MSVKTLSSWEAVESSNLSAISYDASTEILKVRFKTGLAYAYSKVPKDIFDTIRTSSSPGSMFTALVKRASFDFKKIEG